MQAYKLDVTDYVSQMRGQPDATVDVPVLLAGILTAPRLELTATDALRNGRLATRILETTGSVLLTEDERTRLIAARDKLDGWSFADLPLLERIEAMEVVEVAEVTR